MDTPTRRRVLRAGGLTLAALAGCTGTRSSDTTPTDSSLDLGAALVAEGFTSPVDVSVPQADEHYVVDQAGQVYRVGDGDSEPQVAVDLTDRMVEVSGYDERGLLGMAVHPDYDGSGRVYLRYSAPSRSGTPSNFSHTFVLSEFELAAGQIDPESERTLLAVPEPQSNHNAGSVAFGPDGYLYVGVGDGGGGNDQGRGHVADWYDPVDGGNGQDITENLLGSVLRIDVDDQTGDRPYGVPDSNPLVGQEGLDEQFAWGFRNPWRFSFGPDGRFFVADVGQSSYEEINVVERGGNYGWNVREGRECFQADSCPGETPEGRPLRDPIVQYPHEGGGVSGISVIGGYLYDGDGIPALQGRYVFADWRADGELFVATEADEAWSVSTAPIRDGALRSNVLSFGEAPDGELLVCTTNRAGVDGETGAVHRLRSA